MLEAGIPHMQLKKYFWQDDDDDDDGVIDNSDDHIDDRYCQ